MLRTAIIYFSGTGVTEALADATSELWCEQQWAGKLAADFICKIAHSKKLQAFTACGLNPYRPALRCTSAPYQPIPKRPRAGNWRLPTSRRPGRPAQTAGA